MEINGNPIGISTPCSSNEDLSQYTDADESMSAPTEILAEFLSALMVKDYSTAFKLCKIILQYEPNHETAKEFYPLIREKLHQSEPSEELSSENTEDDSTDQDSCSTNDENGNISENGTDTCSSTSSFGDQRDGEETTASYSSLEDEVADVGINASHSSFGVSSPAAKNIPTIEIPGPSFIHNDVNVPVDDNGNSLPSISTNTSDSDSCPEMRKISAKLKSLLTYKKMHKHSPSSSQK